MYPRFLQFGLLVISTYGVLALVAALCGVLLWTSLARRAALDAAKISSAAQLGVLSILVGTRLAVIVANWRGFLEAPLLIVLSGTMRPGGAALCGVLLACVVCGIYLRRAGVPLLPALDAGAPAFALSAAVLDVADFLAGSHYGAPTTLPWGVTYTSRFAARTTGVPLSIPLHPVQLYAAIARFALAAILIHLLQQPRRAGEVLGLGLFAEGILRFLTEPLSGRYVDGTAWLQVMTPPQAGGMLLVLLGGACWLAHTPQARVARETSHPRVAADV